VGLSKEAAITPVPIVRTPAANTAETATAVLVSIACAPCETFSSCTTEDLSCAGHHQKERKGFVKITHGIRSSID
jgi:hypothetical protein